MTVQGMNMLLLTKDYVRRYGNGFSRSRTPDGRVHQASSLKRYFICD
ncbi:hypothetical protein SLCC85_110039 [Listeria monocytogenes]|nr:hypothetical protein SLCC85_110039 [Listeria monocytogenes]